MRRALARIRSGLTDISERRSDCDPEEQKVDVRETLFEHIPEPYGYSTQFQRLVITETGEEVSEDTREACKQLNMCRNIRSKWMSQHPSPPQDADKYFDHSEMTPQSPKPQRTHGLEKHPNDFRRRPVPNYNIFDRPLPGSCSSEFEYEMVKGVLCFYEAKGLAASDSRSVESTGSGINESDAQLSPTGLLSKTNADFSSSGPNGATATGTTGSVDSSESKATKHSSRTTLFPVFSFEEFVDDYCAVGVNSRHLGTQK